MQFKIFNISSFGDTSKEEELNVFLRTRKIISINKQLVCLENEAYWSFCVRWMQQNVYPKSTIKIDYTQALSKDDFNFQKFDLSYLTKLYKRMKLGNND